MSNLINKEYTPVKTGSEYHRSDSEESSSADSSLDKLNTSEGISIDLDQMYPFKQLMQSSKIEKEKALKEKKIQKQSISGLQEKITAAQKNSWKGSEMEFDVNIINGNYWYNPKHTMVYGSGDSPIFSDFRSAASDDTVENKNRESFRRKPKVDPSLRVTPDPMQAFLSPNIISTYQPK